MSILKLFRYSLALVALFAFAGSAAAQGPASGNQTTSELYLTANVQNTVQLNISTAPDGATVDAGQAESGVFGINFGDINAYGMGNSHSQNVSVRVDGLGALYTTPIYVTPLYSGSGGTAQITVQAGSGPNQYMGFEGADVNTATLVNGAPKTVASGAISGNPITRTVGLFVPVGEPTGMKSAILIYDITVGE